MNKLCRKCGKFKEISLFRKLKAVCNECWNLVRREKYKLSVCIRCKEEFRPGIRGRYKFCNEICRFMDKVKKDSSGCWLWQGGIHKDGYGDFVPVGGRSGLAHRASYRLFKGPLKDGLLVLHSCNVPPCVNPSHLRLGTDADNTKDKVIAERCKPRTGEKSHLSKITEDIVRNIRKKSQEGMTYAALSRMFGIGSCQVSNIVRRLSWKHIE